MSTTPADRLRRASALVILLLVVLTGCSVVPDSGAVPIDRPAPVVEAEQAIARILGRRARAVRAYDERLFLSDLAPGNGQLRRSQRRYFANLAQLPLGAFRYSVVPGTLSRDATSVEVVIRLHLQLDGYDTQPVTRPDRFRFVAAPGSPRGYRLASVTDAEWESENDIDEAPWQSTGLTVVEGAGVLGIFDDASAAYSADIVTAVEDGVSDVAAAIPYPWDRTVVLYALSDTRLLAGVEDLPGGDPDRLDGVAIAVRVRPGAARFAGTRFILHPRMLTRSDAARDRLIRHELAHVALGQRDDRVPTWLSEGLAEYVAAQPLARQDRVIAREAVARARAGLTGLPADDTFNGRQSGSNYGIAWWACEYIARVYGEPMLWSLLDQMRGADDASADEVLGDLLLLDESELARQAGLQIVKTFG